ncbi:MAG TPA: cyclic nucleotide-binding domain-containing protein [Guyparkeria sp.]|nr:cyclic nucleotide-binding domain-containing protein [Guyparkeria sp.]HZJ81204.1 cyclic nucleotide-binding domain-containing protein [Guyparkeria sp.]
MLTDNDCDALVDFLAHHVDTQILTQAEISAFLDFCDFQVVQRGQVIADIGEVGESLYFLLEGTAELIVGPTTSEVSVGQILAGEMLGEMSFFDRKPRNVRMRARSNVRLLRLPRVKYNRLRLEHPVLTVLLLEYAIVSLDSLYRRTTTDVAQLNQYIHSMGG